MSITMHTMLHENIKKFMEGFRYDAHPMGIFLSTVGALSTFYPDAKQIIDPEARQLQIKRLIAKMPTIAAYAYRHSIGLPYVYPDNDLSFTGNFLNMLFKMTEAKYRPNPVLERALDVLFILHADHEQNCCTSAMRGIGSSQVDPYSALAGAAAALYGPLHGGANEAVLQMLQEIGSVEQRARLHQEVKDGEGRLMGFGHRVYKSYDPRAQIIKKTADEVFEVTGTNPLLDIALELERIALEDEYFVTRKLYPNVDFYSGLIYQAMGFPIDDVPGAVRDPAHGRAGWRSGTRCCATPTRRSRGRARSTPATAPATTSPWTKGRARSPNAAPERPSHLSRRAAPRLRTGRCRLRRGGRPPTPPRRRERTPRRPSVSPRPRRRGWWRASARAATPLGPVATRTAPDPAGTAFRPGSPAGRRCRSTRARP